MVIGDGVLTPSISGNLAVLSAIQGIKVNKPDLNQDIVVIITCIILFALFKLQRFGTDKVGYISSPVVFILFSSIASIGIYNIVAKDPSVFKAVNPHYIIKYFDNTKKEGWISLGGIVLCVVVPG